MSKQSANRFLTSRTLQIAGGITLVVILVAVVIGTLILSLPKKYEFPQHQKISVNSSLRLTFPEALDHESVEEHLTISGPYAFQKKWDREMLVLTPESPLEEDTVIVVMVGGQTLLSNGSVLGRDMKFTFTVAGAPVLAAAIPAPESADVSSDSDILLVFDRPVVPLSRVQPDSSATKLKDLPVTIEPELSGRWRWLGTTTAQFHPDKGLTPATKYTVNVPAGLRLANGEVTEEDLGWSFETERPRVLTSDPADNQTSAGSTTELRFTFNTPIDLISAKDSIHLFKVVDGESTPVELKTVKYGVKKDENDNDVTDTSQVVAITANPLAFSSRYTATVDEGIRGLRGSLGSAASFTTSFSTVGDFEVLKSAYEGGSISLEFSSPIDSVKLSDFFVFDPAVDLGEETGETYETSSCNYYDSSCDPAKNVVHRFSYFYPKLAPSTKYTLTLSPKLTDRYGQHLKSPQKLVFTTPKITPDVFMYPRGKSFSIFEKAKPPEYFVNNINVSSLTMEFGRLSFDKFLEIRLARYRGGDEKLVDLSSQSEGYQQVTVKPGASLNQWNSKKIDLKKYFESFDSGIYAMTVKAPEWTRRDGNPRVEQRFFALTSMALTVKYSGNRLLVWATDMETGAPISGAQINVRSLSGDTPATGVTNKSGLFESPLPLKEMMNSSYDWMPEFWVTAEKGDDFAFVASNWDEGISPYNFDGVSSDFRSPAAAPNRMLSVLYTERPLYGAGDTVNFKGIARILNIDGKISLPQSTRSMQVTVTDPNGTQVYSKTLKINQFGGFEDSFPIAEEAPLGQYSVAARMVPDSDIDSYSWASFDVLAYRKPEYKAVVGTDKEEYLDGERASGTVSGQYYFGAPMAGAHVAWRVITSDYYFNKYTDAWYSFALDDAWCWRNCDRGTEIVTDGKGELDAAGLFNFSLPLSIHDKPVSQVLTFEADLTDKNNQVVSTRSYAIVHKSNVYVGISSDDYAVTAGEKASVKVITLDPDAKPVPRTSVLLSLYSRKWNVIKTKSVDGEYYYESEPEDTFVRSQSVVTDEEGKARAELLLPEGGEYRVVASAQDSSGHEAKAGWSLYAFADTYFNWPRSNNDRIQVVADKPSYKVGDTAKLVVKTPYQGKGVKALVTIEREQVIEKRVIDVLGSALPVEVQIKDDMVPVAYVSVVIFKPRLGETFDENGVDTGAPAFKMGYVRLPIETESKKIDLSIETDKEKYLPGETVSVKLTTKDGAGKPVQADVSLGVVDLSLLDLTGFTIPDIVSQFYADRGVGIQTANMLLYLMERFKPGSKGGGGDGETSARGNFKDTAYWNPSVITDKNGSASLSFSLPDNLTTWQLLAIGSTKNNLFGAFAKNIVETKRVILRPVRPRFAVVGDKITLGAIVHNYLDLDAEFNVTLQTDGMEITGKPEQKVSIPKNGNVKLSFPVTVLNVTGATMHFRAESGAANDDITESIPVWPYGIAQANPTSGVTEDQVQETLVVPELRDAPTGTLTVSIAPSLGVYLTKGLKYLNEYPYGCAEQVASRFVPALALRQLKGLGVFDTADTQTLEKNISTGLQRLYTLQNSDGGFAYFSGGRSYPSLTAYVLDALRITRETGYAVDARVTDRAVNYLQSSLAGRNSSQVLDAASRAYALYVLSEFRSYDVSSLNALLKKPEELPLFSRAYIAMAYQNAGSTAKAQSTLTDLLNHAKVDARSAHFEEKNSGWYYSSMNSDTRTSAIILSALSKIDSDNVLIPKIVRGILLNRHDGHWDTTQTTAQVILAFVSYLKETDELSYDYQAGVSISDEKVLDASFKSSVLRKAEVVKTLNELGHGKTLDLGIGKEGAGKLYYDILLEYFATPDVIEPQEEGIGIQREVEPLTPADSSKKVGTTQKVTLTITVPETRHFVAVESMLPAGYEPIDLGFATSQQGLLQDSVNSGEGPYDYWKSQVWRFNHIEFRDDRIFLFADELPPGVYRYEYLVRATTPGTFRERPARVFEMYSPETFGQTRGGWLQIKE